jgi:iron complex transport system ATP-binding protein
VISTRDLVFHFGTKQIFSGLSASFEAAKLTAVIGPNGSGKTTLLKILAGILPPGAGSVDRSAGESAPDLMWLPSRIEMPFAYKVREVLTMLLHPWLRHKPARAAGKMVRDALVAAGLPEFGDRIFSSLSAGEQHRIALGAAVVCGARTLVLDEPCANLDIGAAHQLLLRLREVLATGRTLIISIHDLQLAWEYCDEILLLAPGPASQQGTPGEIFSGSLLRSAFQISVTFAREGQRELPVFGPFSL